MPITQTIEKTKIKPLIATFAFAAAVFALFYAIFYSANLEFKGEVLINGEKIKVLIAETTAEKAMGLSGREKLGRREGMLFVYDGYYLPGFWLKDMLIPIDIIWIKDQMVVGYEKNLLPPGLVADRDLIIYSPPTFVNYVLEVNAGLVEEKQIKIGDLVEINHRASLTTAQK